MIKSDDPTLIVLKRMLAYAIYKQGGELEFSEEYEEFVKSYETLVQETLTGGMVVYARKYEGKLPEN